MLRERLSQYQPTSKKEWIAKNQFGQVYRVKGLLIEAIGLKCPINTICEIHHDATKVRAQVVGFDEQTTLLMGIDEINSVCKGDLVQVISANLTIPFGEALLGRVIDGNGKPLDGKPLPAMPDTLTIEHVHTNPLARPPIHETLDTGVFAVNAFLTLGRGQRMGLFAGSGVGKSVLLSMFAKHTEADVIVIGLIGERGREIKEFIEHNLGEAGLKKSVVIAAPADTAALQRINGAYIAASVAQAFAMKGKHVMLLMDSFSRFAQAQREVGLSVGEPPAAKGYPPSVFAMIPKIVEKAGTFDSGGTVTALYTILAEGDDQQDIIVDSVRSFLDGHIVLSRKLAELGHYPAIDVLSSISRLMNHLATETQLNQSLALRRLLSIYRDNEDFVKLGAYQAGTDPQIDAALAKVPGINEHLMQRPNDTVNLETTLQIISQLAGA